MSRTGRPTAAPRLNRVDPGAFAWRLYRDVDAQLGRVAQAMRDTRDREARMVTDREDDEVAHALAKFTVVYQRAHRVALYAKTGDLPAGAQPALGVQADVVALQEAVYGSVRDPLGGRLWASDAGERSLADETVLVLVAAHARAVFDNGPADSVSGWFGQVQLAALASMSVRGVRGAVDRGELPAFSGYVVRIDRARAWLASRKVPGFAPVAAEVPA